MENLNIEFLEEAKLHFNEPVLIGFNVCRIIGYAEDESDCYLIVQHSRDGTPTHDGNGRISWCTFVGGYTYLTCLKTERQIVPKHPAFEGEVWSDYSRLDSLLELNG